MIRAAGTEELPRGSSFFVTIIERFVTNPCFFCINKIKFNIVLVTKGCFLWEKGSSWLTMSL